MTFDEALRTVAEQGASHILKMSSVWYFVYRRKNGKYQARSLNKIGEDAWRLSDHMVASKDSARDGDWRTVESMPARAKALEVPEPPKAPEMVEAAAEESE